MNNLPAQNPTGCHVSTQRQFTKLSSPIGHFFGLPKLKITEFDPLGWSNIFNALIHDAQIEDNAKTCHLKTLVKGNAKAACAGLGNSGALNHTVWYTLVRNSG